MRAGQPSMLIADNLDAQTTLEFVDVLFEKGYCFLHLLLTNCTSELQHIDSGIGKLLKDYMRDFSTEWCMQEGNIE